MITYAYYYANFKYTILVNLKNQKFVPVVLSLQHLETEMLCKQHNQHFSGRKSSVITDVVRESMNEYNVCLMDEPVVIPNSLFL